MPSPCHPVRSVHCRAAGFTLVELLVVMAVMAILASIALPNYQRHLEESRRADAVAGLMQGRQQLERCYTRQASYAGCSTLSVSPEGHYGISLSSVNAGSYRLVADPDADAASGAQADDACGALWITQDGQRGQEGNANGCW